MKRIAVYGKGGIGKSTISANLSAALAHAGRSVLQIGCDPKHDSTKLLLGGQSITCVLDYLRDALPGDYDLSQVLRTGYAGVGCVEAGGPKPGVGCAGRGIISAFEMLEQFRLEDHYDTVVYDVLGDVVCGGFAVPIRREYADTIFIVTSGEFMALYAANNILRGIRTFDGEQGARVAGIVYNQRNIADEEERVARFAQAVGLPVFARVPRSDSFAYAEQANQTVVEQAHDKALVDLFASMAQRLIAGPPLHVARPLSDEELEAAVFGVPDAGGPSAGTGSLASDGGERTLQDLDASSGAPAADAQDTARREVDLTDPNRYLSKTVARGEPLHGCAFNGAVATALHLTDAVVLAHAPTSCANLSLQAFTAAGRRSLFERGTLLPASLAPNLECTNMGETEIVFGGTDKLVETVGRLKQRGPRAIVVVSSCPAGIIGDDIDQVADLADEACPVLPLKTDGNMSGDYLQGQLTASLAIARTFVAKADPRPNTASIFAEKMVVTNTQSNYELVAGFLERMGVQVQCRFLHQATVDEVAAFGTSQLCLPAYTDYAAQLLGKLFSEEFGLTVFDRGFPIGYDETVDWLRAVGDFYGKRDIAEQIVAEQEAAYEEAIGALSKRLAGKKLMVVAYNCELDWILKTALDAGMQIVRIGILDYSQDVGFRTRLGIDLPVVQGYAREDRAREIIELAPDVLLTNYSSAVADSVAVADTIPMCPDVGFMSGVALARRWARLMDMPAQGSWKNDAALFGQGALPRNGRAQGSGGGRA